MTTAVSPACFAIDGDRVAQALRCIREKLDSARGEIVLDWSRVLRVDSSDLQALEALARAADESSVKIVLQGTNVEVYKVLKLARLTGRFAFVD